MNVDARLVTALALPSLTLSIDPGATATHLSVLRSPKASALTREIGPVPNLMTSRGYVSASVLEHPISAPSRNLESLSEQIKEMVPGNRGGPQ